MEALSAGLCVVSTDVQSIPYVLREGKGIIVRKGRLATELYNVLKRLLKEPGAIQSISTRALEYAKYVHSNEALLAYLKNILEDTE